MNSVYIVWLRNGFAGPEWRPERICENEDCAKESLELFEKHYKRNMGYELKVTEHKVYKNVN